MNLRIVFDQRTIPEEIVVKASGVMVRFDSPPGAKPLIKVRYPSDGSERVLSRLSQEVHFTDLTRIEFEEGSRPTFDPIRPQGMVPKKERFEFIISVNGKPHKISGSIAYSRNPRYNPHALEQWIDPCEDL